MAYFLIEIIDYRVNFEGVMIIAVYGDYEFKKCLH